MVPNLCPLIPLGTAKDLWELGRMSGGLREVTVTRKMYIHSMVFLAYICLHALLIFISVKVHSLQYKRIPSLQWALI